MELQNQKEHIMDSLRFDRLTTTLTQSHSRRGSLHLFGLAALTATGLGVVASEEADARRRKRKRRRNRVELQPGDRCQSNRQCPEDYHCDVPVNGSNSDTYCCGAQGAGCGAENDDGDDTAPYCCVGYECVYHPNNGSWTCEAAPDEI
jgi:hypothetical protein